MAITVRMPIVEATMTSVLSRAIVNGYPVVLASHEKNTNRLERTLVNHQTNLVATTKKILGSIII